MKSYIIIIFIYRRKVSNTIFNASLKFLIKIQFNFENYFKFTYINIYYTK